MYNKDSFIGGYMRSPFVAGLIVAVFGAFCILITGCAATNALGERLLKAKVLSEKEKGALVVCTRANALMYGGGNIAIVKTTKSFSGTVEVKQGCGVKITTNPKKEAPSNPAEDLLNRMFDSPASLVGE